MSACKLVSTKVVHLNVQKKKGDGKREERGKYPVVRCAALGRKVLNLLCPIM